MIDTNVLASAIEAEASHAAQLAKFQIEMATLATAKFVGEGVGHEKATLMGVVLADTINTQISHAIAVTVEKHAKGTAVPTKVYLDALKARGIEALDESFDKLMLSVAGKKREAAEAAKGISRK